ncbi:ABC transporter ATP-binding protein/permease, partial [Microcoleus anatoxicus]|uniref:ABC transporter ATP-binding protein/permease n=1 Tax=Microcoleus anatoxicus TaxID=2705319 RepID=UPI0030C9BCCA
LYSGLIVQVETSLQLLIGNYTNLYDISLGVSPIFQLLDLKPELQSPLVNVASRLPSLEDYGQDARATNQVSDHGQDARATKDKIGIEIKDLSFCYPGSTKSTIANIDLTINPGEMLVLVGENGAGKTTLGKLLGRLYDPTSGTIAWNGKDLRSYPLAYVRSRIAVVMQDYARFPSTVRENVGFGDLLSLSDDTAINEALNEAGIA